MNLRINIKDNATPWVHSLGRALKGDEARELHLKVGHEVQRLTVDHISQLAATRHGTAEKLGASPTNHFAQAAEKVSAEQALATDASGVVLTIRHPGFARAFRDVKIVPRTAKSLAIPIHAVAYGHRAAELWERLSLFIPKGRRVIAATIGGVVTPLYILCRSVTQKQDRTLLPSDEEFRDTAVATAKTWLSTALLKEQTHA